MAKLSVVIPAVDVMLNDVTYRKVDRDAQAGDIIRFTDDHLVSYVTNGAFYEVTDLSPGGNPRIIDEDGDRYSTAGDSFEVYAPISEPATQPTTDTITFQSATWRKVYRGVREGDAIKFTDEDRSHYLTESELYVVNEVDFNNDPHITDDEDDSYDAGGEDYEVYEKVTDSAAVEYREVNRKASVGERIKIVAAEQAAGHYGNGEEHVVSDADRWNNGNAITVLGINHAIYHREYVVLEPVTKAAEPERLKVGEYARVVDVTHMYADSGVAEGSIVKITQDDESYRPFKAALVNGDNAGWFTATELVRTTDEEVAAAKRAALSAQFSVGDKVRLISGGGEPLAFDYENGGVYTVKNPRYDSSRRGIQITGGGQPTAYVGADQIVKLTAEEAAEIERKQAEEKRWAAIGRKVNEYRVGDLAKVIATMGGATKVGDIVEVSHGDGTSSPLVYGNNGSTYYATIELIVPVEQRFDRAEEMDAA